MKINAPESSCQLGQLKETNTSKSTADKNIVKWPTTLHLSIFNQLKFDTNSTADEEIIW